MTDDSDRDLRRRFSLLRDEDRRGAPAYSDLRRRLDPRPARSLAIARRLVWPAAAAAAVALVIWYVGYGLPGRPPGPNPLAAVQLDLNRVVWESPTDFLLDVPGRELLTTMPTFGVPGRTPMVNTAPDSAANRSTRNRS